jgi:translation initiation factor IF-2
LAKQLNTNSKRLTEKLNEINIFPKSHMSFLEEDELSALFEHIGYKPDIKQEKKQDNPPVAVTPQKTSRDMTIVRRVVNIVEEEKPEKSNQQPKGGRSRKDSRVSASTGLRAGYEVRKEKNYDSLLKINKSKNEKSEKSEKPKEKVPEKVPEKVQSKTPEKVKKNDMPEIRLVSSKRDSEKLPEIKLVAKNNVEPEINELKKDIPIEDEKPDTKTMSDEHEDTKTVSAEETVEDKTTDDNVTQVKKPEQKGDVSSHVSVDVNRPQKLADKNTQVSANNEHDTRTVPERNSSNGKYNQQGYKPKDKYEQKTTVPEVFAGEPRRDNLSNKDHTREIAKDNKRDVKKDTSKPQPVQKDRYKSSTKQFVGEKKGVNEVFSDEFRLNTTEAHYGVQKKKGRTKRDFRNSREVKTFQQPVIAVLTNVKLPEVMTVKELSETLKKTSAEVIKKMMLMGILATLNQEIDFDTAAIISDEFGIKAEKEINITEEDILFDDDEIENDENLESRPPVVVVMGHVDHGKTSLLDAIRSTNVITDEAGGITQHIGAYMVKINNRNITFIDTPGHEAFTAMRARGAKVTDIAIIVVAADDGVMPQTVEAINHAKAANVGIIVAVNKIDKPDANVDKVKHELMEYGLVAEEWGGDTIFVPVSAKKKENIDKLLEMVLLSADMLELKADPKRQAKGTIIEAKLDRGRGAVATLLVQRGTLLPGDTIVSGSTIGHVRLMLDDKGHSLKKAGPSTPVEITGLPEVPEAGEIFYAVKDEKLARHLADKRKSKQREENLRSSSKVSLEDLFTQIQQGNVKDLNIIVKADVQGSVEAVKQSLEKLSNDEVCVKIIHGAVGAITESDIALAEVSNAIIIGFNVRPGINITEHAQNAGVDMRLYRIIYEAIDDIKAAMTGMLEPQYKEAVQGHAEIRKIYKISGIGSIAGCYVIDGKIVRNSEVRLVREGIVVFEGKLSSLKRFKDDVKEAAQGFECGLSLEKFNDIKENDIVECYIMEEIERG